MCKATVNRQTACMILSVTFSIITASLKAMPALMYKTMSQPVTLLFPSIQCLNALHILPAAQENGFPACHHIASITTLHKSGDPSSQIADHATPVQVFCLLGTLRKAQLILTTMITQDSPQIQQQRPLSISVSSAVPFMYLLRHDVQDTLMACGCHTSSLLH